MTALLFSACAAISPSLDYTPGVVAETISSPVSVSFSSGEQGVSAQGYILYKRPDKFHLVILSPFGTTIFEAYSLGERILIIYPAHSVAYIGNIREMPDETRVQGLKMIPWIMDADPSPDRNFTGKTARVRSDGINEEILFSNGLVASKKTERGDIAYYSDYTLFGGVALAKTLELVNRQGDTIRISLSDPEINSAIEETAFTPRLDGITLLPLQDIGWKQDRKE